MRRILLALTFLALAAAACGSDHDTTTVAIPGDADIDAPARLAEPEPTATADPCADLRAVLEDLDAILEAGHDVYAARLTEAVEPLDADAAASISILFDLDGEPENDERALGLIEDLDTATYAACEIPAISAVIVLDSQWGPVFCPVSRSIDEDDENLGTPEEPCPPPAPPLPTVLPCFDETGVPFLLDPLGAYEAVDCDTHERVAWDVHNSTWIPDDRESVQRKFSEVDSALG